jgi:hypothetical protein
MRAARDPVGEADERLTSRVVAEQERQQQTQQRKGWQQECDELCHAARILSALNPA